MNGVIFTIALSACNLLAYCIFLKYSKAHSSYTGILTLASTPAFDDLKRDLGKHSAVFDWDSATKKIEHYLATGSPGNGEVFELLGDYCYNLAFQQKTRSDFKSVLLRAISAFERVPNNDRCRARAGFCRFWISESADGRRAILEQECLAVARDNLSSHLNSTAEDEVMLSRAYGEVLEYISYAMVINSDRPSVQDFASEGKKIGRETLARFKNSTHPSVAINSAHSFAFFMQREETNFVSPKEQAQLGSEIEAVIENLQRLADVVEDPRLRALAHETAGFVLSQWMGKHSEGFSAAEKGVLEAEKTKDLALLGRQLQEFSWSLGWAAEASGDPEERRRLLERSLDCASKAGELLNVYIDDASLGSRIFIQRSINLARDTPDVQRKQQLLDRAIEYAKSQLYYGNIFPIYYLQVWPWIALALTYKAELSSYPEERRRLVSEAVDWNVKCVQKFDGKVHPGSWNLGITHWITGITKARLAEELPDEREPLLKDAVSVLEKAARTCSNAMLPGLESRMARIFEDYASAVARLYHLTNKRDYGTEAIKAFDLAIEQNTQGNLIGSIAPISWKIANLYDAMSEYSKSASAFRRAAQQYEKAAAALKNLQKSFSELSAYMFAWSKIEDARLFHSEEKYQSASDKLREAATIMSKTETYRHLTLHYLAFSKMEEAEELSSKEDSSEAALAFGKASELLQQSKSELLELGSTSSMPDSEVKEWAHLSESRGRYSLARMALEEAKTLDKNGEIYQAMAKYRTANESFQELVDGANLQDVPELEALALVCDAWSKMKEAELKSSPELFTIASEIFLKAKENNMKQSFVLSCLANSSICAAFEAGTRFKKSRDVGLYSEIKKKLGAASQYYEEAGFEVASDWTSATEALFDALAYLAAAEAEIDSAKKSEMYHLAEKHLELSARRYGDIGYDKKRQEVLKQLKKARENRELLITPMQALSQNPTVSSSPVNFTRDQALGLERFEAANLTGSVSLSNKLTNVGSILRIDFDIANVGKSVALLMKLDNVAPLHGFEADPERNQHHFIEEAGSIAVDLKGKRLEYLKAHALSLHFLARTKGTFEIKPKVLFVDELGKYRSYEFEPQTLEVKELGFMGWAKGK